MKKDERLLTWGTICCSVLVSLAMFGLWNTHFPLLQPVKITTLPLTLHKEMDDMGNPCCKGKTTVQVAGNTEELSHAYVSYSIQVFDEEHRKMDDHIRKEIYDYARQVEGTHIVVFILHFTDSQIAGKQMFIQLHAQLKKA